jgi:hypothetical protein
MTVVGPSLEDRLRFRRRLSAGLKVLQERPECNADRIAAIGYCIGGCGVLELTRAGAALRGVVSLHRLLSAPIRAQQNAVVAKILVLHGDADPVAPAESVIDFLAVELRVHAVVGKISKHLQEVVESHQPIIDALEKGRGREAGLLLRNHVETFVEYLEKSDSDSGFHRALRKDLEGAKDVPSSLRSATESDRECRPPRAVDRPRCQVAALRWNTGSKCPVRVHHSATGSFPPCTPHTTQPRGFRPPPRQPASNPEMAGPPPEPAPSEDSPPLRSRLPIPPHSTTAWRNAPSIALIGHCSIEAACQPT